MTTVNPSPAFGGLRRQTAANEDVDVETATKEYVDLLQDQENARSAREGYSRNPARYKWEYTKTKKYIRLTKGDSVFAFVDKDGFLLEPRDFNGPNTKYPAGNVFRLLAGGPARHAGRVGNPKEKMKMAFKTGNRVVYTGGDPRLVSKLTGEEGVVTHVDEMVTVRWLHVPGGGEGFHTRTHGKHLSRIRLRNPHEKGDVRITARNPRRSTTMPEAPEARDVDVTIEIGDEILDGEVTLLPHEQTGEYTSWGGPDHWVDNRLLRRLYMLDEEGKINFREVLYELSSAASRAISRKRNPARKEEAKSHMSPMAEKVLLGLAALAAIFVGYEVLKPKPLMADTTKQLPSTNAALPGVGAPLFARGDTVIVAMDTPSLADGAYLTSLVASLAAASPDLVFVPVPLLMTATGSDGKPALNLQPIEDAILAAPGIPGLILIFTPQAVGAIPGDVAGASFGKVNMVEIPPEGMALSGPEAALLKSQRSATSRVFGLTPAVPRVPVSAFAASLLLDTRNPAGLPADRTV